MANYKTDVIYKITKEKTANSLELGYIYFTGVPVTYAQVHKPAKMQNSDDTEYQMNIFINEDTMNKVEELGVNKEFAEVGVTKKKKGPNRGKVKYPVEGANENYGGMYAAQLSRKTVKRDRKTGEVTKTYDPLKVIDKELTPIKDNIGNGSICNIRAFCYRYSGDDMIVMQLDTVQVVDLIPYESSGGGDGFDEILGGVVPSSSPVETKEDTEPEPTPAKDDDSFDDDIPF